MRLGEREGVLSALRLSRVVGLLLMAFVLTVQVLLGDGEQVPWRQDWWDAMQRISPRDRGDPAESPVVIVAIEGNTMSLPQTRSILETRLAVGGKSIMEHNEVLGLDAALKYINQTLVDRVTGDIRLQGNA